MKNKKIYLLALLLLVCILSISTISATKNTTNKDVISADNNKEYNLETNIQYDEVSNSKENDELNLEENNYNDKESESKRDKTTTENEDPLNFNDLNTTINNNTNSTIYLSNNYKFNNNTDSNFQEGILINRNLTIYGNGITINGTYIARIFNIPNSNINVNFYNINFIDTYTSDNGGAIFGGDAYNCTFTNNAAINDGGAIYNGNAYNCTFTFNYAGNDGGAIYNGNAYNSTFTYNQADFGGAIYNGSAYNCTFTLNEAYKYGGAIYQGNAYNCTFKANKAEDGGATYNINAYNCTFDSNIAVRLDSEGYISHGGAMYQGNAYNSTFKSNVATHAKDIKPKNGQGGGIYEGNAYNCTFISNNGYEGQAMFKGKAYLCRFEDNTCYHTDEYNGKLDVSDYNSTYQSGERLKFKVTADDVEFDDIQTLINISKADGSFVKIVYGLSGKGWIVDLIPGEYKAKLNIIGYPDVEPKTATIKVSRGITTVVIDPIIDVKVGKEITITYNTNSNGTITIKVNGQPITDGKFTPTTVGTYHVTIDVAENEYYTAGSNETTFTAEKTNTTILISPIIDYVVGETIPITFTTNSNATATIKVNGQIIPDRNFTPTKAGTYNLTIEIEENDYYKAATNQTTLTVEKTETLVLIAPIYNVNVGQEVIITYLTNSNGTATIKVNGTPITDGKFTPTKPGTYNITVEIAENDYYKEGNYLSSFEVGKAESKISANPVTTTYNVDKNLVLTLKDSNGKAIKGAVLTVNLGSSKNYTTDANGQIKINVATLTPKTYNAKITYNGSDIYKGSTSSVKVTVKKATPKITAKAANYKLKVTTKKYTINLKDNENNALKNTKVSLKVNGKTYSVKTNSKGQAVFKITNLKKKGTYTAVITVPANTYYNKVSKNVKITVKP